MDMSIPTAPLQTPDGTVANQGMLVKDRPDDAQPTNSPARYRNDANPSCFGGLHGSPVPGRHSGIGAEESSVEIGRDEHPATLPRSQESVPVWVPSVTATTIVVQGIPARRKEGVRWRRRGRVLVADPRPETIRDSGATTTPSHELLTASTPAFFVPARLPPNLLPHLDRAPPLPSPRSRRTARREWPRCAMSRRHGP
ncbi:hypothetical protein HMPREF9621_02534 [Cutibacterium modestum HL037PA2]|nr:hypothetical protein HMPREF9621_02534 [Cutibacterium modestum HL037PA2]